MAAGIKIFPEGTGADANRVTPVVIALAAIAFLAWIALSQMPKPPAPPLIPDTRTERQQEPTQLPPEPASQAAAPPRDPTVSREQPQGAVIGKATRPGAGHTLSARHPLDLKLPRVPESQKSPGSAAATDRAGTNLPPAALWNYWLEAPGSADAVPHPEAGPLQLGVVQQLDFRLSLLDLSAMFARVGSTALSKQAMETLRAAAMDPTRSDFPVNVVVHSVDDQRLQIVNGTDFSTAVVNLDRLRGVSLNPATKPGPGTGRKFLDELQRANVAQFSFQFVARAPGTHQASVTLVDSATGYPLESLIIDISPGQAWPKSVQVDRGASRLFGSPSAPFDLALFIYELKTTAISDDKPKLIAELWFNEPASKKRSLITWRTNVEWDGVKTLIENFRKNQSAEGVTGATFLDAGESFGNRLFNPLPPSSNASLEVIAAAERDAQSAALARQVLVKWADYPEGAVPPTLVTRIFSKTLGHNQYESLILPFGALGVSDDKSGRIFLGKRFAVSLLLAGQEVVEGNPCPSAWHFTIPSFNTKVEGPILNALTVLKGLDKKWTDFELVQDTLGLDLLKKWIHDGERSNETYVFAYLGHQANDKLYLSDAGAVYPGTIRRQFNGSSVAILNACTTAVDRVDSETIIGVLADRSVAATIATTTTVSGPLAAHYVQCMQAVLEAHQSLTAAQANTLTIQCLWSPETGQKWPGKPTMEHTGEALAYLTIGNPFQRICAPAKRATQ